MATIVKKTPRIIFISREQVFRISLTGLLPFTVHNVYLERQKISGNFLKPLSGSLGDPLKTDSDGKLIFDYYFQTGLPAAETTVEQAQEKAALLSGTKQIIIASISESVFPSSFQSILSYCIAAIHVQVAIPSRDEFVEVEVLPTNVSTSVFAT